VNDQLSIRVAWLYYLENLTQAEIGERLGLTRARVNRMLAEARESGLVRISLNSSLAECVALEQALRQKCNLRDAVVVPTPADPDTATAVVGMAAGDYLSRHRLGLHLARNHPPRDASLLSGPLDHLDDGRPVARPRTQHLRNRR
jgi:DNA-binding transcriptional regulator LsrR (DeoR family)